MNFQRQQLRSVLQQFIAESEQLDAATNSIASLLSDSATRPLEGVDVDLDRARRCGFPEVVFAEGKPSELVAEILKTQLDAGQAGFATRVSSAQADVVLKAIPAATHNSTARTITVASDRQSRVTDKNPAVAVVSAGSCDAPVAQEALETLRWMNISATLIEDVGVAGPQRLLKHVAILQQMRAIVCVAGMEAALPSVVGGHVPCPVIGVPTSVGYGASFGGVTALLSMLTCCASNVVTVNIDAGFRGGYVAGMIARNGTKATD